MTEVYSRVLRFVADPSAGDFDELAIAVFRHQYENCPAYRAFCESRNVDAAAVETWRQVPAVPILAFKWADISCGPPQRVFQSTGTTEGVDRRSRHSIPDLRLSRAAAIGGLRRYLFPDVERMDLVSLIPPVADRPDSSLAQMAAWAAECFGRDGIAEAAPGGSPAFELFCESLRRSERDGAPLAVLTTTGALIHFLEYARSRSLVFRLPHGSRLMDTGGSKGSPRSMSRKGLLHAIWGVFAIPGYYAVNEYGMAELSSQYYDSVIRDRVDGMHRPRRLVGPPWVRTAIVDPDTRGFAPPGTPGLVCHFDLANAGSAMAVLSEDIGVLDEHGLRLIGRAPRAESRGCSMNVAGWHVS